MVWDGLICLAIIVLAIAGWQVGIVNSWRGPFAIVMASVGVQHFYVDFATWIVQQMRIPAATAVVVGYILLWLAFEISSELLLSACIHWGTKHAPRMFERLGGAMLGVLKVFVFVLLPLIVVQAKITVPEPPKEVCQVEIPMPSGLDESSVIAGLTPFAKSLVPTLGKFVVSTAGPSFEPVFNTKKYKLNPDIMDFKTR